MAAPGTDRRHPDPQVLLDFLQRHAMSLRYIESAAAWVRECYPASADELVPKIREIYRDAKARNVPY
jgi:hypothetical protein